ncbi:MAG TPA: PD-(D/E)XK nuclease family protein [Candidatus Brocadiia bacterium]|nr:PD-(D/E)XK nuclease family protein [Candidatus Brocadiales bacterium]
MLEEKAKVKLEEKRNELHISYGQIRTYLTCPRRYRYQYVMGMEWEEVPAGLVFGKAIHEAVAGYYRQIRKLGSASHEDMLKAYRATWERESKKGSVSYKKKETEDSLSNQAVWLLEVFMKNANPGKIEAVEMPFSVEIVPSDGARPMPYKLVGVFDLVESDNEGNFIISELKTASRRQGEDEYDSHLQATIYSYALKMLGYTTSEKKTLVRYDVLLKTKKGEFERYYVVKTEKDYQRMFPLIKDILKAIEQEIYYPRDGWYCSDCPFKGACQKDV